MSMKNAFDVQHPIFNPLWRRVLVVVLLFGWALFEWFGNASPMWAILFGACGTWCAHQFFFAWNPKDPNDP